MIQFKRIKRKEIPLLQQQATEIWNENYQQMIGQAQIDYMLGNVFAKKLQTEFDENYI